MTEAHTIQWPDVDYSKVGKVAERLAIEPVSRRRDGRAAFIAISDGEGNNYDVFELIEALLDRLDEATHGGTNDDNG